MNQFQAENHKNRIICQCGNDKFLLIIKPWGVIYWCDGCGYEGCFDDPEYEG